MSATLIDNYGAAHGCSFLEAAARLAYARNTEPRGFEVIVRRWGTPADAAGLLACRPDTTGRHGYCATHRASCFLPKAPG